jgi:hypothetical protein
VPARLAADREVVGTSNFPLHRQGLVPRLIVGFVTAHFSQLWCGMLIDLANALSGALTSDSGNGGGALQAIKTHMAAGRNQAATLLFVVCVAIIAFLLAGIIEPIRRHTDQLTIPSWSIRHKPIFAAQCPNFDDR